MTRDLTGQVVMITGAARGLGAALARELAGRGARLALVGLEPDELQAQAEACGNGAQAWTADVTDQAAISAAAEGVRAAFGRIDVLVANAGVATGGTLRIADPVSYDRVVEVNLLGSIRTARAALPHLIDSKGFYLQIASAAALVPNAVMGSYCASKSGVEAFAHSVRSEVRHLGVGVGIAYPLWIDTEMVRGMDEYPAFTIARKGLPWPMNKTYPVAPAVRALADAVAARRVHTMFPRWLWFLYANRAISPSVTPFVVGRLARRAEKAHAQAPKRLGLTGAGGAADDATRSGE
ncbi:short-chain dehydrogenase/reductase [Spongisporangium articulatum]|uniref:Short-chain dehydrogenase/reductase n=1 Tax=Spongisporangium articulatum TaxID=3362603 RepID=A0ABW8AJW2_9ACTN